MDLTDEQWDVIKPLIPQPPKRPDHRADRFSMAGHPKTR